MKSKFSFSDISTFEKLLLLLFLFFVLIQRPLNNFVQKREQEQIRRALELTLETKDPPTKSN